ncbi:MAG TPA: Fic family protein [Albitalea sp.]|uniref:Fic family protein n=1 Tax=Piscinibacter sp. TaxID=1903157 RepID=UPI002ED0E9A1
MKAQRIEHYDAPHQFEPLLPEQRVIEPLLERASDLTRVATKLGASAAAPAQRELRVLLRSMNSYYTNRIEGEHTRPSDIDRALQNDFSSNAELARKQRLAVAHIRTEEGCERTLDETVQADEEAGASAALKSLYGADALVWLHEELFTGLTEQDLRLSDGSVMIPGVIRETRVAVGRHEAPLPESLGRFIERWATVYGGARRGEASLVAAAASHHRLAWIHPFPDGNGRVARLHTHLALHTMGLTHGLWSPLRGFARTEERYKALLQAADEHRHGDLDGRGNLSQAALIDWIQYTLDVCIDQVQFMSHQIDMAGMRERLEAALAFEEAMRSGVRREALIPLHYLFVTQSELGRAEFKTMTGLGDRLATDLVSSLLRCRYLATDSAYGKVRFAIPRHALRFLFPALWPEAEQDQALISTEMRHADLEGRRPPRRR